MSLQPRIRVIGARVFLTREHVVRLFGEGARLEFAQPWGLQAGFVSHQRVDAATALGRLSGIAVMGPVGGPSRLECPLGQARALGLEPPVRHSGDVEGAPRVTLLGPRGHVEVEHGVITLTRRLECSAEKARQLGLMDGDRVLCALRSRVRADQREALRDGLVGEVYTRVSADFDLELHLDSDDAAAFRVTDGDVARLLDAGRPSSGAGRLPVGRLVGERDVRAAREQGLRIRVTKGMVLTPSARDLGREWDLLDFE